MLFTVKPVDMRFRQCGELAEVMGGEGLRMRTLTITIRTSQCLDLLTVRTHGWQCGGLAEALAQDMAREGLRARTITLKLKTSKFEVGAHSP